MVTPVKADSTAVVLKNDKALDYKFHVVAGCFQVESNAVNYIAILQQQNITASIIGQNEKGFYVVSCGDFASRKEATAKLNALRNQQQSVWLYKN
jgi:septal ring-binding cell division protein DamX